MQLKIKLLQGLDALLGRGAEECNERAGANVRVAVVELLSKSECVVMGWGYGGEL